jgi:DnaJ-class molecular chaperone
VFKCPLCEQEYETVADMLGRVRVQLKSDYYDPTPDIELTGDLAGAYMKLGLPPGCTADEVKKAYRRLMKSFHPDKAANLGEPERIQFEERSKELNRAYSDIVKSQS